MHLSHKPGGQLAEPGATLMQTCWFTQTSTRMSSADDEDTTSHKAEMLSAMELMRWFQQVPHLTIDCAALAWKLRAEQPVLLVEGGTNSRIAKVTCLTREMWTAGGMVEEYGPRFASPTFNSDRNFFLMISRRNRPDLPVMTPRYQFPRPPEEMDGFVAAAEANQLARDARAPGNPEKAGAPDVRKAGAKKAGAKKVGAQRPAASNVPAATGDYRKSMPREWVCDVCNKSMAAGTECTWYEKHTQLGDFAICSICTDGGVTADSQAQHLGCPQM